MTIRTLLTTTAVSIAALSGSWADDHKSKDIVDTAVAAGSFKTLAAALQAADLVDALKGDGPFTVFAPTDEAFAKLPKGTVETLLKPENKDKLTDILTYHVVAAKVPAADAVKLTEATALNKKKIALKVTDKDLFLNKSKDIKTDINCSNGIIHVIDAVLLPPAEEKGKSSNAVRKTIHKAIAKGVPLFNHGNHGACAEVYVMTAQQLMEMPKGALSKRDRKALRRVMRQADKHACATTNAWTYRKAFDRMLVAAAH